MYSPMNDRQKNAVSIASFGGYNHTDFTAPGEWYEMKNISGRYLPLLTPRRSREHSQTLPGATASVLLKNGLYYYSAPDGIYCYAPGASEPVLLFETTDRFSFLEMGNKVLCVNETDHTHHVYIEKGMVCYLGETNAEFRSYTNFTNTQGEEDIREVVAYLNKHNVLYRSMKGDCLKTLTQDGAKWKDTNAVDLLNITFTYETEDQNGGRYVLYDRTKYNPASPGFSANRFFLGTDNKFYFYNNTAAVATEVTAPNIAILLHLGRQTADVDYPNFLVGDYINLSVGYSMNYNHVTQDYHIYPTKEKDLISAQQLRINRVFRCDGTTASGWYDKGWEYCLVADYNAVLINTLIKSDLFTNSTSYLELTDYNIADPHNDPGRQQVYPRYVRFDNPQFELIAPLEHNNRIWGANNANNELKASAQGNFRNWDEYRGLVSDSYAVSIGSDGDFTASFVIDDYLFFFKEHSYTMVYGTRPSNFCTNTVEDVIGISADGAASVQVIGKSAYFMGIDGKIYRFNGSESTCISAAFGDERYTPLSSAHTQNKYYLLLEQDSAKRLFVYHTDSGLWFAEDAEHIDTVTTIRGQAAALAIGECQRESGGEIEVQASTDILLLDKWSIPAVEDNTVEWSCVSGLWGLESDFYQFISNLKLTYQSEVGAFIEVLVQYDEGNAWEPVFKEVSERKQTRTAKIRVKRCAFMRLKIRGKGFSKIFRVTYLKEQGSEK